MDMSYTPEEEAFRARVREWLEQNVPPPGSLTDDLEAMRAWQRKLHAAGLLAVSWPKEYGGAGLSPMEQAILNEELARVRAPGVVNAMAIWWVGPAIMRYGTDAQKKRFIPPILTADEIWATGYSEPTSGSDMAAAKMRAVRDGDVYVVNGQKIWTTLAHISDWYFVLVRTSTDGPKWAGLSLLLVDMRSPGITVRPPASRVTVALTLIAPVETSRTRSPSIATDVFSLSSPETGFSRVAFLITIIAAGRIHRRCGRLVQQNRELTAGITRFSPRS